jgi:general secretion pathway protein H|tara:strand:+ start:481 stop:1200 length:720 start_codon:yes stop_codon:yes gene_type:complete
MKVKPLSTVQIIKKISGFTLIEMMLVIMLIGVMATFIQFNAGGDKKEKLLQQTSIRFAGIFEIAAEYSMLNNVELGLLVDKTSYRFLAYDGSRWTDVGENELLVSTVLPEGIEIVLELDDLPIEEPLLFDTELLEEGGFTNGDDDDDEGALDDGTRENEIDTDGSGTEPNNSSNKRTKKLIPQVYILSGGDISPFSLTFYLNDEFSNDSGFDQNQPLYRVSGIYSVPLKIEGPRLDEQK